MDTLEKFIVFVIAPLFVGMFFLLLAARSEIRDLRHENRKLKEDISELRQKKFGLEEANLQSKAEADRLKSQPRWRLVRSKLFGPLFGDD